MEVQFMVALATLTILLLVAVILVLIMRTRAKAFESKYLKTRAMVNAMELKYSKIIDIDFEVEKSIENKREIEQKINSLQISYKEKRVIFEKLVKEASIYDEEVQLAELGFYKPHFDFDTSEKYKEELASVKQQQKDMISSKEAIYCTTEWTVGGNKAKGQMMVNRGVRLTARAFNNECDAATSNIRWNNVARMEQRVEKAYQAINKLNESSAIVISDKYYQLKLKELGLAYEYADKKQQEKEEQREIKRQMREEAKLEQEMERALKEEEKYNKLLDKAKKEADKVTGSKLDSLNEKISKLSYELREAHTKSERAKSMAEQTKRGHVYIISNIGSFGEGVYKIGMTRRLEPLDRVKELGDASVPFTFDVHALIHSEDAPALENALHKKFDQVRINLINSRKEFFRVGLSDIESEVKKISPDADFIETAEARDFRQSQNIISQRKCIKTTVDAVNEFPEAI